MKYLFGLYACLVVAVEVAAAEQEADKTAPEAFKEPGSVKMDFLDERVAFHRLLVDA